MASPTFLKDDSGLFMSPSPGFLLVRVFFESESGSVRVWKYANVSWTAGVLSLLLGVEFTVT